MYQRIGISKPFIGLFVNNVKCKESAGSVTESVAIHQGNTNVKEGIPEYPNSVSPQKNVHC